jgi:branched-chain amino acid transport system ATP-binding protein
MLNIQSIDVAYDQVQVIYELSLSVKPGEILCLLGRNGAGKTTTLKSIMGLVPVRSGSIELNGQRIDTLSPHLIPLQGVAYVPQGRRLFSELSVQQNMQVGLMASNSGSELQESVLALFPRLRERLKQRAETLSGGEQQMLAMARALCMNPKVILLDEPTEGLQPSMISLIRDVIVKLKQDNVAVILVEQHVDAVLSIADRVAFIEHGRNPETMPASELVNNQQKLHQYLGV